MNHLIILSGGVGSRMKSDVPKQYIEVCGKPIISWTLGCIDFSLFALRGTGDRYITDSDFSILDVPYEVNEVHVSERFKNILTPEADQ